jgi:hypothetical protein
MYNTSLKMTRTPFSENSFYIIEDDYIWFINENENLNRTAWPQKVSYIFPTISGKIDAILFDESKNEFLIFKVNQTFIKFLFIEKSIIKINSLF